MNDKDLIEDNAVASLHEWWEYEQQMEKLGVDLSRKNIIKVVI